MPDIDKLDALAEAATEQKTIHGRFVRRDGSEGDTYSYIDPHAVMALHDAHDPTIMRLIYAELRAARRLIAAYHDATTSDTEASAALAAYQSARGDA